MGTLEAYLKAHQDILEHRVQVDMEGFQLRPGVWVGKGAEIDPSVELAGPAVIGDNCVIAAGARLGEYCTLGRNLRVGENAVIERSVVHDNTYLGSGVRIEGSVLGRGSDLRQGVRCDEGAVLGDECFVGAHAEIKAGVKIYPFKTVEAGAVVNSSIVWESRGPGRSSVGKGSRGWRTWTSAPSWPFASRWPGPPPSRRGQQSPPPGTPAGPPGCSSGP